MPAPKKYPDEIRERAVRLVFDVADEAGNVTAACRRVGEELGINVGRGWVRQAQAETGKRPGTTSADAARIRDRSPRPACVRQPPPDRTLPSHEICPALVDRGTRTAGSGR